MTQRSEFINHSLLYFFFLRIIIRSNGAIRHYPYIRWRLFLLRFFRRRRGAIWIPTGRSWHISMRIPKRNNVYPIRWLWRSWFPLVHHFSSSCFSAPFNCFLYSALVASSCNLNNFFISSLSLSDKSDISRL